MQEKNSRIFKNKWSREVKDPQLQEEKELQELSKQIKKYGWKCISQKMNLSFPDRKRSSKQCREHYINFTKIGRQGANLLDWTREEDDVLLQNYLSYGSKWVQISNFLPGRSQNSVKNHFYCSLRKLLRRVNKVKKQTQKKGKLFQQGTIYKLLETQVGHQREIKSQINEENQKQEFIWNLKYNLLKLSFMPQTNIYQEQVMNLVNKLNLYKSMTRFDHVKKHKEGVCSKRKRFPPLYLNQNQNKEEYKINEMKSSSDKQETFEEFSYNIQKDLNLEKFENFDRSLLIQDSYPQIGRQVLRQKDLEFEMSQICKIPYKSERFYFEEWY